MDVRINGQSIVQDGVAKIPMALYNKVGIMGYVNEFGVYCDSDHIMRLTSITPEQWRKSNVYNNCAVTLLNFEKYVKAAMCDGKGAAWTTDEQAAARERMGAWTTIADITLDEDVNIIDTVSVQGYRKYSVVVLLSQHITIDCYIQPRLICGNSMSAAAYENAKNMTFLFFDIEEFGYIGDKNSASLFGCESYKNEIGAISPNIFKYSTLKVNYNSAGKFPFLTGIGVVAQGASIPSGSRIIIRGHN